MESWRCKDMSMWGVVMWQYEDVRLWKYGDVEAWSRLSHGWLFRYTSLLTKSRLCHVDPQIISPHHRPISVGNWRSPSKLRFIEWLTNERLSRSTLIGCLVSRSLNKLRLINYLTNENLNKSRLTICLANRNINKSKLIGY